MQQSAVPFTQSADANAVVADHVSAFLPDSALISVLNDLSRQLKDPDELSKIENADQRAVLGVARQILAKALTQPELSADRIVKNRARSASSFTTEAWSSGEVKVSPRCRGSLAAVWAKHENGLLNITIAGECNDKVAPNGKKIGELVVILNGKSAVESGFDIQSQSDVCIWMGRLAGISIESACISEGTTNIAEEPHPPSDTTGDTSKPPLVLQPVITQRGRQYLSQMTGATPATATPPANAKAAPDALEASMGKVPEAVRQPDATASLIVPDRAVRRSTNDTLRPKRHRRARTGCRT